MRENKPQLLLWFRFWDVLGGPRTSWFPLAFLPPQIVKQEQATYIPMERGGADAAGFCASVLAGGIGNQAHIPPTSCQRVEGPFASGGA